LKPKTITEGKMEASFEEPRVDAKTSNNDDDAAPV